MELVSRARASSTIKCVFAGAAGAAGAAGGKGEPVILAVRLWTTERD